MKNVRVMLIVDVTNKTCKNHNLRIQAVTKNCLQNVHEERSSV